MSTSRHAVRLLAALMILALGATGCGTLLRIQRGRIKPMPEGIYDAEAIQRATSIHADVAGGLPEVLLRAGYADGTDLHVERPVGPGVVHTFESRAGEPLTISTVTAQLSDSLRLETTKTAPGFMELGRVADVMNAMDRAEGRPIVGINADFWGAGGVTDNFFVAHDVIVRGPRAHTRPVFAFDADGNYSIGNPRVTMTLQPGPDAAWEPITIVSVNVRTDTTAPIAWTWPYGDEAPATGDAPLVVQLDAPRWLPNEPAPGRVVAMGADAPRALDKSRVIVDVPGGLPDGLAVGDEVVLDARYDNLPGVVVGATGGGPELLRDGEVVIEESAAIGGIGESFITTRHPRTAVGISADGERLVMMVVDGRQTGRSRGVDLHELAGLMREAGCDHAMNLDGGGSSTMVVHGEAVNFPSDAGGPRRVTNALVLRAVSELGKPSQVTIVPPSGMVPPRARIPVRIEAHDANGEPVVLEGWRADLQTRGRIANRALVSSIVDAREHSHWLLIAANRPGDLELSVVVTKLGENMLIDHATYTVAEPDSVQIAPGGLLLDPGDTAHVDVVAFAEDGTRFSPWAQVGSFLVLPPFLDLASPYGGLRARQSGAGHLRATMGRQTASIPVAVGDGARETVLRSGDELPPSDLRLIRATDTSAVHLDDDSAHGDTSWRIEYELERGGTARVDVPIEVELPTDALAVRAWVRTDGQARWLRAQFRDAHGQMFLTDMTPASGAGWTDWRPVTARLDGLAAIGNHEHPLTKPLAFWTINITETSDQRKTAGMLWIDHVVALDVP